MTKSDRDWQADDDFRTLVSVQEINSDKRRLTRARGAGRRMIKKETRALGLKRQLVARRR